MTWTSFGLGMIAVPVGLLVLVHFTKAWVVMAYTEKAGFRMWGNATGEQARRWQREFIDDVMGHGGEDVAFCFARRMDDDEFYDDDDDLDEWEGDEDDD